MLTHPLAERLRGLGMAAMADAFLEMQSNSTATDLAHEDWLGLLLDREVTARDNKRLGRRLSHARLRQNAVVEDTDFRAPRGLDRALFHKLAGCDWIPSQPALADRRPDRDREVVAGLRARPQSLPGRPLGAVSARAAAVRRTRHRPWRGQAATHAGSAGAHPACPTGSTCYPLPAAN